MARNRNRRSRVAKAGVLTPVYQANNQLVAAQTPDVIEGALVDEGMASSALLGPGRPINPVKGYSQDPRAFDFPAGVNIQTSGRSRSAWGRTSFDTLKALIDAYDVARTCINHKIDEIRGMEPLFLVADDVSGNQDSAIAAAKAALAYPDRERPFEEWLSLWLEDCLRYDTGTLYKRRDYNGEVIGLEVLDGTTVLPYIDEHGRRPAPPAPAWYQGIKGLPWTWLTTDEIIRTTFRPQAGNPFGLAPIESILLTANTDLRFQWHFLQMFTEGSVPAGFMELPPDVSSPDQVRDWQAYWDVVVMGDQAKLHQLIAVPGGSKFTETRPKTFDKTFPEYLAVRTAAAFGVVPQDLGIVQDVNRANGETQTDMQFRVNTLPWVLFVQNTLSRYLQNDLGLPVQVKLNTGREKEDRVAEAQAWQIYVQTGAASVDEMRQEVLGLPIDNTRPVPRFIDSPRTGPVPLRSVYAIAGPIDPETAAPIDTQPLDTTPFSGAGGVLPDKLPGGAQFHRASTDPDDPANPALEQEIPGSDVVGTVPATKPVIQDPAQGQQIQQVQELANPVQAAATNVDKDDTVAKGVSPAMSEETKAYRRFLKARLEKGSWRDFRFEALPPEVAELLNAQGRELVAKAAGERRPKVPSWY